MIVAAAGVWVLYAYPPADSAFYPRCAFKMLTGLDCPGCGLTRASHHVLHGEFAEAFRLNPLLFAMAGVVLFALPSAARGRHPAFLTSRWFGWGAVLVVIGWWIVRNL